MIIKDTLHILIEVSTIPNKNSYLEFSEIFKIDDIQLTDFSKIKKCNYDYKRFCFNSIFRNFRIDDN